ncbi:acylglycerol kinase family protein, partial [Listeria monocytogenes]|uniref:acylglycerol kinase family protein n=1 Tax=Listeria monocytogenes TaxID=1639 RepID=UPI001F0ECF16
MVIVNNWALPCQRLSSPSIFSLYFFFFINKRKNAKENQVGVLVVIGGDGTIHHAVQNFKDTIRDYQIGIIPG